MSLFDQLAELSNVYGFLQVAERAQSAALFFVGR
jgi:hypothetical protein